MQREKKLLGKWIVGIVLCLILCSGILPGSRVWAREGRDLMQDVEYEEGEAYHNEGDLILTADYTLPENTWLHWYDGDLTIASGVTLTIPESSFLDVSNPEDSFVVEKGACIRIEGAPQTDAEENPVCHLKVYGAETRIEGAIESENVGLTCRCNKTYLNGTIHAAQQFLITEQCQVYITGGEYSSRMKESFMEVDTGFFESVIEISGGRFSDDELKNCLLSGYTLEKQADGMYEAVLREKSAETDAPVNLKEQAAAIWEYAGNLLEEARQDSIQEDGTWINGDIIVVLLCVAVVAICLLLVIIDFIRSPLKKKGKILVEVVIAVGVVGGGILFLWNQVQQDRQIQSDEKYADYEENTVPDTILLQNKTAGLNGLEVFPEGTYLVGRDLEPGLYFFEAENPKLDSLAYYVYSSDTPDFHSKEIGAWVMRSYLELQEGSYIRVIDANFVKAGEQPPYEPIEEEGAYIYPAGEYLVGYDIEPGTYQMTVDLYEVTVTDEALDDKTMHFSEYEGQRYDAGPTEITWKEGQHLYVHAGVTVKLEQ